MSRERLKLEKIEQAVEKEVALLALPGDLESVQNAVGENPQKYARWSIIEARLRAEVEKAVNKASQLESELMIEYNDEAAKNRKHLTDTKLKACVKSDERLSDAKMEVVVIGETLNKVSAVVQAYSQRGYASQALLRSLMDEAALNIK